MQGPAEISFWWKKGVSGAITELTFFVDGDIQRTCNTFDWANQLYSIEDDNTHEIKWAFTKKTCYLLGKAWIDNLHIVDGEYLKPPVVNSFTTNPTNIKRGESAVLSWNVNGATTVFIDHEIGKVEPTGTTMISPEENVTYTLTAANNDKVSIANVTLIVIPPAAPIVNSFTTNPTNIERGESAVLSWNVDGATTVFIDHEIGKVRPTGTTMISPEENVTYTLTAANNGGVTKSEVKLLVTPPNPPMINLFTTYPSNIEQGESAVLSWNVDGATTVFIGHGIGEIGPNGWRIISPEENVTYTLTATNEGGITTFETKLIVRSQTDKVSTYTSHQPLISNFTKVENFVYEGYPPLNIFQIVDIEGQNACYSVDIPLKQHSMMEIIPINGGDLSIHEKYPSGEVKSYPKGTVCPKSGYLMGFYAGTSGIHEMWYTITNETGIERESIHIEFNVLNPQTTPPIINSFKVSPANIEKGSVSLLSWSVSGATTIFINQGIGYVGPSGSKVVSPDKDVVYTLTANNGSENVVREISLHVVYRPDIRIESIDVDWSLDLFSSIFWYVDYTLYLVNYGDADGVAIVQLLNQHGTILDQFEVAVPSNSRKNVDRIRIDVSESDTLSARLVDQKQIL